MQLFFVETAMVEPVAKSHVLQFAFAALIAYRTIQRMVRKQKLDHVLARFVNLRCVGFYNHAFHRHQRARRLQLRRFFHFNQTHPASRLQRKPRVVAERRNLYASGLRRFEHKCARRRSDFLVVDCKRDLFYFRHGVYEAPTIISAGLNEHLPRRWSSNSCRHFFTILIVGSAAASPSGQNVLPNIFFDSSSIKEMSSARPPPSWKRSSSFRSQVVPSRQGMHQPQDSCA